MLYVEYEKRRKIMVNLLKWDATKNVLRIEGALYNSIWFQEFGKIQNLILYLKHANILINMMECVFISPTPFLSLLLTLNKAKNVNNCNIEIVLPMKETEECKKFLNYCARDGFLEIINQINEYSYDVTKYKDYNVVGVDNFERILGARIINIHNCNVEDKVSELIQEINENNLNVDKNQQLYVKLALRNMLQELIDNVKSHAYYDDNKYFAVYIRMRYATDTTKRTGVENNRYEGQRATTKPCEVYIHKAIEVYFQDIGKGIVKSLEEKGTKYKERPLRESVREVFFKEKFEKRQNKTSINGLAILRKILQEKNNYFSVYNQREGTGTFSVDGKKIPVNSIRLEEQEYGIEGQIYNFTLFDREKNIYDEPTECYDEILEVYQQPYRIIDNFVIDLRKTKEISENNNSFENLLLFMPEYLTKGAIVNTIKNVVKTNRNIRQIIISDIKDEELGLFVFVLSELYRENIQQKYTDTLLLKEIYVVTKSLKIKCFNTEKNKFREANVSFKAFNKNYEYLYRLKVYESQELAHVLEHQLIGKYILTKGRVEWTDGQVFSGFLNFDMLVANDICFDLLQRNLERFMPIVGNKRLYAIDTTVDRLVNSINCFSDSQIKDRFGVGSVLVSGMTLQSSDYQGNAIHFFNRGRDKKMPALFFYPKYLLDNQLTTTQDVCYVRVGKSSRIKRKDFKETERTTNSYLAEKETYKILHQFAYSSVLCGHLNFEKRHDLLSINLNAIMYDESTKLKEFMEGMIRYSLGHYVEERLEENVFFNPLFDTCMIVYPYNYFTSTILKMCNVKEDYKKYMVGLSPTNITSTGEDLEYSLCFTEYISEIFSEYKKNHVNGKLKVVIFDTLSYSGKTKQEIYEYVNSIENIEPYFVNVIDARVNHYPKHENFLNYMNVNIPLLGKSETCKLCLVLSKLSAFRDNIIDAVLLATIDKMQEIWKVRDVRNYKEIIKLSNFDRIYAKSIVFYNRNIRVATDELYFVNALPLYIFITNRIKTENDFYSMEYVIDTYLDIIGEDSMAYILSFFLLEYGNSIYHSLLRKVCDFLLKYMGKNNQVELRQLSALAILSLDEKKVGKIVIRYIEINIDSIQINPEIQIVLMYFLKSERYYMENEKIIFLYNKMKTGNDRLDLYKQFHCQLKNTNGNVHNSPLKRLIGGEENIDNIKLALNSLTLLEQSLKCTELSFDMLYENGQTNDEMDKKAPQIREKCLGTIFEIKKQINCCDKPEIDKEKLREVFFDGQELHKTLFAPYIIQINSENRNLKSIVVRLAEIIEMYNEKRKKEKAFPIYFNEVYDNKVEVSRNIDAIFYVWNNMLVQEINYIFDNVTKFVSEDKTVITVDGRKAAGEVCISITPSNFIISVYNNTNENVDEVERKAKQRYQKEVLGLLGVKFDYCKNMGENPVFDDNAIITRIIIPNIQNRKEG